jgi:hypothetical protein
VYQLIRPIQANSSAFPGGAKPSVLFRKRQRRLAIGILNVFKAQPKMWFFIAKPLSVDGKIGRIPPIEPERWRLENMQPRWLHSPFRSWLTGEISWPG